MVAEFSLITISRIIDTLKEDGLNLLYYFSEPFLKTTLEKSCG